MQGKVVSRMGALAGLVAAVALVAAGCGTKTIDQSSEVDLVNKQLSSDGLKSESVDCPDDVEAKEGDTFTCDFTTTNGRSGVYTITIENVEGDNASLRVTDVKETTKK
jgi:hypothetical protein